jgi:hypothetical protein
LKASPATYFINTRKARRAGLTSNTALAFNQSSTESIETLLPDATVGWAAKLACYKFETPEGFRAVHVLVRAHSRRVERGDHHITDSISR